MKTKHYYIIISLFLHSVLSEGISAPATIPRNAMAVVNSDNPAFTTTLKQLSGNRDKLLASPFFNVVSEKKLVAPGGNPHDYVSVGPYFWPNPDKADGLPYLEKDGIVNPNSRNYDNRKMWNMCDVVVSASLLYYFLKDEGAADHAVKQLQVFFLDEATRMNPNLKYGQGIPGKVSGRPAGMIDTFSLIDVVNAIGLLKDSTVMTSATYTGLQKWFADYAGWMRTDPMARKDWEVRQNHGISYHIQIASYLKFAGDDALALEHLRILEQRITETILDDGVQPAEVRRTKGWSYSIYTLSLIFYGVGAAADYHIDLLDSNRLSGRKIRAALDYLCSFIDTPEKWPHQEITGLRNDLLTPLLLQMYFYTGEEKYLNRYREIPQKRVPDMIALFFSPHAK